MNKLISALGLLLSLTLSSTPSWALFGQTQTQPLDPKIAFSMDAEMPSAQLLRVEWAIKDGYYLYKDKFTFTTDQPGISLGSPQLPAGKKKHDEFFGEVETYRNHVVIDIPITITDSALKSFTLTTSSQGCADIGICYPPLDQTAEVEVVSTPPSPQGGGLFDTIKGFGSKLGFGSSQPTFVEPDKAFIFSAEVKDAYTLIARWEILDGYYLYRDKFRFELADGGNTQLGAAIQFPKGKMKEDEYFGRMEVYYNQVEITIPLQRHAAINEIVTLIAHYQGCADAGLCYPPIEKSLSLTLPASDLPASAFQGNTTQAPLTEQDQIVASLGSDSLWITLLTFFGFGLLLSLTPCVFPMIPILSGIIIGHGEKLTTRKSFAMSVIYVLAMALTYTAAGVIAGLFGENLQATFQNPWILGTFSLVFVLLALSMFGFYELQVPSFIQSKLTTLSNKQRGGTYTGVAVMGFLSALIVGPCVAAPLAGALIYIGQTGDAALGGMALFALSIGMGAPLLLLGASAGKLLPKAGPWMDTIKAIFGVLLIAVAIYLLERIIPPFVAMTLWATLFIVSAIYMGALTNSPEISNWGKLWKGIGFIFLIYGVMLFIGASSGSTDMLKPLDQLALSDNKKSPNKKLDFNIITSLEELEKYKQQAEQNNRFLLVDFYADWCVSCKEMEKYTFSDPMVQSVLKDVILVKADVTKNDEGNVALLKSFGIFGPPATLYITPQGTELLRFRLVGFMKADAFAQHSQLALSQ